ncbi:hypothetical protein XELAEV_18017439mg [Xenopus laevis]|uniref:Uncharacterized protein n=1 Tax=Xenopus laevis TaxID=8355 RepID=A0A974DDY3_XENLA|nr:hypothetical protein XELAEV_18017439mg [Xenopus laevis]
MSVVSLYLCVEDEMLVVPVLDACCLSQIPVWCSVSFSVLILIIATICKKTLLSLAQSVFPFKNHLFIFLITKNETNSAL